MRAKDVEFEVTFINLLEKPDWFLKISPHGKVPVLKIGEDILFESNAIAEFLDETVSPRLHPEDPIERARNRAWTDFVSSFARALNGVYYTKTREEMEDGLAKAPKTIERLEEALTRQRDLNDGPYFNGPNLSLVDCAYAPFLQRFLIADGYLRTGLLDNFPKVKKWADALLSNETVIGAVAPEFLKEFEESLRRRKFYVASLLAN
ncbi:MAG: glutathione S-transferase [Alphaproteobacteria bacterium]|nr:glutathione S-transferase [Alphaproteobacteria bacterium]|tara:strand:- start:127 stop:744 length:618 start_codon:yes stop_codon:yes gene_type:complete